MTLEFKLIKPTENEFVKAIEFNFEELRTGITEQLKNYQNLVYTDETIKNAKEDRAKLNKFKEAVETARKDVKKRYLEPYNQFEAKVKEIVALIEEPTIAIDTQVKAYEQCKKDGKRKDIEAFYFANIGDLVELIPFEKMLNEKWLNLSVSLKNAQEEMLQKIEKIKFDLQTIKDLKSEWELTLIDTYLITFDISAALREKTRLEERKQAIEERENQQKEVQQIQVEEKEEKEAPQTDFPDVEKMVEEKIHTRKFWVKGTADQLKNLGQYMKENGIEYGGIE